MAKLRGMTRYIYYSILLYMGLAALSMWGSLWAQNQAIDLSKEPNVIIDWSVLEDILPPAALPKNLPLPKTQPQSSLNQLLKPALRKPSQNITHDSPSLSPPIRQKQPVRSQAQTPPSLPLAVKQTIAAKPNPANHDEKLETIKLEFANDQPDPANLDMNKLSQLVVLLQTHQNIRAELLSYVKVSPPLVASTLQRLSLQRAKLVADYLVKQGIATTRIHLKPLGNQVNENRMDVIFVQ